MKINPSLIDLSTVTPTYGATGNWVYWKFPISKFFIAIIPQKSLTFSSGSLSIALPFECVSTKSVALAMGRWNNQHIWIDGGIASNSTVVLNLGNNYSGTNMTNVLVIGEYS